MVKPCLHCGIDVRVGRLCPEHGAAIATAGDFTAEQIITGSVDSPSAWLIDQWGVTHPVSDVAVVGRDAEDCHVAILHHTVSSMHAQILRQDDGWQLVDRGSLNGTFLQGLRIRESAIRNGDLVGFGDVSLYFSEAVPEASVAKPGPGRTVRSAQEDLAFSAVLKSDSQSLELSERPGGGIAVLMDGRKLDLATLEFALLMILTERRQHARHADLAYVSSRELAEKLAFRSQDADSDNVRELIRRVRKKFQAQGIDDLIESRQGVGYRVGWQYVR